MDSIAIETTIGVTVEVEVAARRGAMAVTRQIEGSGWTLTHVETGFRVPFDFAVQARAIAALGALDALVDWEAFLAARVTGRDVSTTIMVICEICESLGGRPDPRPGACDTEVLAQRRGDGRRR
ncbi:MAG TPA: hypothetical protein VLA52_18225 [Thermohalobaculum sp.]|nr:hypothetical protein [Thermohalobaculum sp.]